MRRVFNYPLVLKQQQEIEMPAGAKILSVGLQSGTIQLWALEDDSMEHATVFIELYGTGHSIPTGPGQKEFIGTVTNGSLVWHIFERVDADRL